MRFSSSSKEETTLQHISVRLNVSIFNKAPAFAMAQFLDTKGIIHYINQIFKRARKELVIVSPFIKLDSNTFERLSDADERGVQISLLYGKDEINDRDERNLVMLRNLSLFYYHRLHAKCFFNEHEMVIGSMNLYDSSSTNREMGILLQADGEAYQEARIEVESIFQAANCLKEQRVVSRASRYTSGHCIRCSSTVEFNPLTPLCYSCYQKWAEWSNEGFQENFCHMCGQRARTCKRTPVCNPCYANWVG